MLVIDMRKMALMLAELFRCRHIFQILFRICRLFKTLIRLFSIHSPLVKHFVVSTLLLNPFYHNLSTRFSLLCFDLLRLYCRYRLYLLGLVSRFDYQTKLYIDLSTQFFQLSHTFAQIEVFEVSASLGAVVLFLLVALVDALKVSVVDVVNI